MILGLTICGGLLAVTTAGTSAIFVLFALEVLGLDATGFGVLLAVAAVGGITGSLIAARVAAAWGRRRTLLGSLGTAGIAFAGLGVVSAPVAAAALFATASGAVAMWNTVTMSVRQTLIPNGLFGRVLGAYRMIVYGAVPLGAAAGGLLAQQTSLRSPFALTAVGHLAALLYAHRFLRTQRIGVEPPSAKTP